MFWILLALIFKFVESEDPWYLLKCIIQTLILSAILQHQFFLETPLGPQVARPPHIFSCLFLSGFQRQIQNKQERNLNKQHIAVNSSSLFWRQAGLSAPPACPIPPAGLDCEISLLRLWAAALSCLKPRGDISSKIGVVIPRSPQCLSHSSPM